ncbi:hypothetical protein [Nocardiopsis alborubida]|uniref:hypothetical protein n=2 Tax=Nocardiopsis alborubida TaxID=146802 RepID=UPI00076E43EB|nr:hypothetical protein [Nocardiopsis alborubida]
MAPLHRHGALPLLAALVLTTGCGPQLDLRDSPRLEALLPSSNAYPDGFDVDELDVDELQGVDFGGEAGTDDFGDVEPAECGAVLNGGTGRLPAGAAEGAAQIAAPSGSSSGSAVYGYVLVSGDFGDAPVEGTGFGHLLDTCSRMSVSVGGTRMEGALVSRDSPALPEGGGMFSVTLYGERTAMAARTAWGQVGEVYFVLVGMNAGDSSDVSTYELMEACPDEIDMDCMDSHRVRMATEENERMAEDFEEVLSRAVEKLERAA